MENKEYLTICPNCVSTEYIEDYPSLGNQICIYCGSEPTRLELKIVGYMDETPDQCPHCRAKQEQYYESLFEDGFTYVFKCNKCGKLDGYVVLEDEYGRIDYDDNSYAPLAAGIAEHEGTHILSKTTYQKNSEDARE